MDHSGWGGRMVMKGGPAPPNQSDSNAQIVMETNGPSPRLYQVWRGRNRFFLGGRLIFGPDFGSLFLTMSLILVPVILFCTFVSQELFNQFPHRVGYFIAILPAVITAFIIILLFLTSGRDPGIIPRNAFPPGPYDDGGSMSIDWSGNFGPLFPPTKEVTVNGKVTRIKYCHTCMLYRPPRCSHCSICNNCVERFDHHCPWVGQCIGKRNYQFFFMFIFFTTVLCLYVFSFCWVNIRNTKEAHHCQLWKAFLKSPVSAILIVYTFLTSWFVGGLTAFHLYLISTNQTTYENFRNRYDRKSNPYDIGCARNFKEILFSKIPKSKNNFRAKLKEGDSSFCSSSACSYSLSSLSPSSASVSLGQQKRSEMPKSNFDLEMGHRYSVGTEEFEDIQSQTGSVGPLERDGIQPRHST